MYDMLRAAAGGCRLAADLKRVVRDGACGCSEVRGGGRAAAASRKAGNCLSDATPLLAREPFSVMVYELDALL